MRKIIYGINLTADGCCDHTQMSGSDEMHIYFTDLLREADLIIYGRKTYELMVPYWPEVAQNPTENKVANEFARVFDSIEKIVCSRSSNSFPGNPRVIRTNLAEEIMQLKQAPGKNISIGGVELPGELIKLGLVDEFYFLVHPVLAGQGRRLLDGTILQQQQSLKLADTRTFPSGSIALHYLQQ
ncbi:Dihydrofolate reductase [Chitinophaga jiangningensis]|uniref:Dihydrofolate reductase n=1 Tax=Chitinophaga jiangningensis TaxID=1419482 RepID=A0A1M6YCI9_9BACT|nr:dihydrofolate reductase family protein [Chitinophaga jiangningensis]SHL16007.1 Dihydrofolate reductase [Chitinophaga jiangningensis]